MISDDDKHRIDDIRALKEGWGENGLAFDKEHLAWLKRSLEQYWPEDLAFPVCPYEDGKKVAVDWYLPGGHVSIDIELFSRICDYSVGDDSGTASKEGMIVLLSVHRWKRLAALVRGHAGDAGTMPRWLCSTSTGSKQSRCFGL